MDTLKQIRLVRKPLVFLLCLVPFAWVITDLFEITGTLGANPVESMLDRFGVLVDPFHADRAGDHAAA